MKDENKAVCLKIKEFRYSMKLTQSQFAELVNLSEDCIGKIERCITVPKIETLCTIADSLKVLVETFLASSKEKKSNELSYELAALVTYLKTRPLEDARFIHELAINPEKSLGNKV